MKALDDIYSTSVTKNTEIIKAKDKMEKLGNTLKMKYTKFKNNF